jgi:hypothetical protein
MPATGRTDMNFLQPSPQTGQLLFSQFFADTNTKRALTEEQFTKAD